MTTHVDQALRDIGTLGQMACERGSYEAALHHRLYSQLMAYGFKPTRDNLNEFSEVLATFTCIALENVWLSNYEIPDSPYYCTPFFNALKHILNTPATNEASQLIDTLYRHITLNEPYPEINTEDTITHDNQVA